MRDGFLVRMKGFVLSLLPPYDTMTALYLLFCKSGRAMSQTVLIVDDDPVQRRILEEMIIRSGFQAIVASGGLEALSILESKVGKSISVVLLDLQMPEVNGLDVLSQMRSFVRRPPVIVQTANGSMETAIIAMRAGACDFVVKPISSERLVTSLHNAMKIVVEETTIKKIKSKKSGDFTFDDILTKSSNMKRVLDLAKRAAGSEIPVMIEGESGVGKELIAKAIQSASERKNKAFVTVNCGAIPENLVESILFGHEKGAFTGAVTKRIGKFEEADGGTLFLDEVGELPLETQVKLLRAIQQGEVEPVGGKKSVKVDIRIISATNQNMIDLVKEGKFRDDLYYRLNVFPVMVPPLRKRMEDVPALLHLFMSRFAMEERKTIKGIDERAMELLGRYPWPGNVRQLENAVFRAVVLADSDVLGASEFPQISTHIDDLEYGGGVEAIEEATLPLFEGPAMIGGDEVLLDTIMPNGSEKSILGIPALGEDGEIRTLRNMEEDMINLALGKYKGKMTLVARHLGIGRSTLYRKMQEFGIDAKA